VIERWLRSFFEHAPQQINKAASESHHQCVIDHYEIKAGPPYHRCSRDNRMQHEHDGSGPQRMTSYAMHCDPLAVFTDFE
jgi:hypothetical protein